jgi:hypothetical protein
MIPFLPQKATDHQRSKTNGIFFNHEWHEFSRMESGFAGEFHCRYHSCSFGEFVVQMFSGSMSKLGGLIRFPCLKWGTSGRVKESKSSTEMSAARLNGEWHSTLL